MIFLDEENMHCCNNTHGMDWAGCSLNLSSLLHNLWFPIFECSLFPFWFDLGIREGPAAGPLGPSRGFAASQKTTPVYLCGAQSCNAS